MPSLKREEKPKPGDDLPIAKTIFDVLKEKYSNVTLDDLKEIFANVIGETRAALDQLIEEQQSTAPDLITEETAMIILKTKLKTSDKEIAMAFDEYFTPPEIPDDLEEDYDPSKTQEALEILEQKDFDKAKIKNGLNKLKKEKGKEKELKVKIQSEEEPQKEETPYQKLKKKAQLQREEAKKEEADYQIPDAPPESKGGETVENLGHIVLLNGNEGSGKTSAALTFPRPFLLDLEQGKFKILLKYRPDLQWMKENQDFAIGTILDKNEEIDYVKTNEAISYWINWFKNDGFNKKDTFIIDVGKEMWDAAWGSVEQKKGKGLSQKEFIPITKKEKKRLKPFIYWCQNHGKNLVIVTHWGGKYKDIDQWTSICVDYEPDVKQWIRDLVAWRIDMIKPKETGGIENCFIADFQKAPGSQYFKIDITDKSLFEIIDNPELLAEEKANFKSFLRKRELDAKKEGK